MRARALTFSTCLAAVTMLGLSGCSSAQTVSEACIVVQDQLVQMNADLSTSVADIGAGDYAKVVTVIDTLQSRLSATTSGLGNSEVKESMAKLTDEVGEFGTLMRDASKAGDDIDVLMSVSEKASAQAQNISKAAKAVQEVCL